MKPSQIVPCPDCGDPILLAEVDRDEVRLDAALPVWQRYRDPIALRDVVVRAAGVFAEHRCAPRSKAKRGRRAGPAESEPRDDEHLADDGL